MGEKTNNKIKKIVLIGGVLVLGVILVLLYNIKDSNSKRGNDFDAKGYTDEQVADIKKYIDEQIAAGKDYTDKQVASVKDSKDDLNSDAESPDENGTYLYRTYLPMDDSKEFSECMEELAEKYKINTDMEDRKSIIIDNKDNNRVVMVLYSEQDLYNIALPDIEDCNLYLENSNLNDYIKVDKLKNEDIILDKLEANEILFIPVNEPEGLPSNYLSWESSTGEAKGIFLNYNPFYRGENLADTATHIDDSNK